MLTNQVLDELADTVLLRCPQLALTTRIVGDNEQCLRLWPLARRHGNAATTPSVLIIDSMRTTPSIPGLVGVDETLFFIEVADGPDIPRFDVTGFLWRSGLSVIDVDRVSVFPEDMTDPIDVVLGRARLTPERIEPKSKALPGPAED